MPRRWLRLLVPLSATAFLLVNSPLALVTAARQPALNSVAASRPQVTPDCSCCCEEEGSSEHCSAEAADCGHNSCDHSHCPNAPCNHSGPCCPTGCAWCCVAKVPGLISCTASPSLLTLCLDQSLTEPSLLLPPDLCGGLIRPPRA